MGVKTNKCPSQESWSDSLAQKNSQGEIIKRNLNLSSLSKELSFDTKTMTLIHVTDPSSESRFYL